MTSLARCIDFHVAYYRVRVINPAALGLAGVAYGHQLWVDQVLLM
jgi:hypothetical protein